MISSSQGVKIYVKFFLGEEVLYLGEEEVKLGEVDTKIGYFPMFFWGRKFF